MSLIPSGELKVQLFNDREFTNPLVSMSLIPSGELKVKLPWKSLTNTICCINESNSLRGVERIIHCFISHPDSLYQ